MRPNNFDDDAQNALAFTIRRAIFSGAELGEGVYAVERVSVPYLDRAWLNQLTKDAMGAKPRQDKVKSLLTRFVNQPFIEHAKTA